jgi:hypothetical protein
LYDPVLGRFLSPDPYISDPSFSQSYNRYSYCLNNPLKYSDPSGDNIAFSWLGNWLIGGLDRWINKGDSFKQAFSFRNNPFIFTANFNTGNYQISNYQVDASKVAGINAGVVVNNEINDSRQSFGTITAYNPGFFDSWSESSNFVLSLSYSLVDDISVSAQSLFVGPRTKHLNGTEIVGDDRVNAFVSTAPFIAGGITSIATKESLGIIPKISIRRGKDIVGTTYDAIKPTQDWINPEKVAEYKYLLQSGKKLDPIITYKNANGIFIEDGHHRFVAYMKLGMKPNMFLRKTGGPVGFQNWIETIYQVPFLGY